MNDLTIIVVHYSPLKNRFDFLVKQLPLQTNWITEASDLPKMRLNREVYRDWETDRKRVV